MVAARRILLVAGAASVAYAAFWLGNFQLPDAPTGGRSQPISSGDRQSSIPDVSVEPVRELEPRASPGERLTVELIQKPAATYSGAEETEADAVYAELVAGLGRRHLVYDNNLGQAARELAVAHSTLGGLVPQDVVDFLLHSSGAVDKSVIQAYTRTGGDDLSAVKKRLAALLPPEDGTLRRVGIGEAYVPGAASPRYIAILLSERAIHIFPAPRTAQVGTVWQLTGTLPAGYDGASGLALYPNGAMEAVDVVQQGRRFTLRAPATEVGTLDVSLSAVGPFGPGPLLQVPVHVGRDMPTTYNSFSAADETGLTSPQLAEELAWKLLNDDRARFGLPALPRDPELDAVARSHGLDMRDQNFFGHYSPDTGTPGDRLASHGYRAATHGENVATGPSINGAQVGLMHSLGHRKNIVGRAWTHVGIGVAGKKRDGRVQWYLTQMFARPVARLEPAAGAAQLVGRLDRLRTAAGLPALMRHGRLDRLCEAHADLPAAGGTEGVATSLLAAGKKDGVVGNRGAYAWVGTTTELGTLELPAASAQEGYSHVGVAVRQLPDHPNGLIGVVLLFTQDPS